MDHGLFHAGVKRNLNKTLLESTGMGLDGGAATAENGQPAESSPQKDERVLGPGQWPLPVKTPYLTSDRDAGQGNSSTPLHVQETVLGKTFEEDPAVR